MNHPEACAVLGGSGMHSKRVSELCCPWPSRKSGEADGVQFVMDAVPPFGLEEAAHSRLACQLLAACSGPGTSTDKCDTPSHGIGHVRRKPALEPVYFLWQSGQYP